MRVVCPHVGPIDLTVCDALDVATGRRPGSSLPHQWDAIDVSQADTAYTRLLATLWALGETFAIVEHDIVVRPGALAELESCTHTWCAFPYQLGRFTTAGLGCTKFSAQLIRAHPHAVAETWAEQTEAHPRGHWCPTPDHRVLTADLAWRPIGEVEAGDRLVAFDEHAVHGAHRHYRNYQLAEVVGAESATAEVIRIAFDDAPDLFVTPDHPLLVCGRVNGPPFTIRWELARDLAPGRLLPRYLEPVQALRTYEAGYLAGLFDGEGCLYGNGQRISFSQKPGPVHEYGKRLLRDLDFTLIEKDNGNGRAVETKVVSIRGGIAEGVKFLSQIQPRRLLAKVDVNSLGVFRATTKHRVVAVEPAGRREIRRVQTTTGTYLLEGMGSHNCNLDDRLTRVLMRAGAVRHEHAPVVEHLNPIPSHGCS